jgi:signal transduction histidine kinase/ActR/RegA family two-component response regulator
VQQSSSLLTPVRIWRERLSVRLVSAVLGMSLLCAILLTGYHFRAWTESLEAQIESTGQLLADTIALTLDDAVATEDRNALEQYGQHLLAKPDVILTFVRIESASGEVLNGQEATASQRSWREVREFTSPVLVRPENIVLGRCVIGLEVSPFRRTLREQALAALLQNFFAFSLISTVLTVLLRAWLGRPLQQLDEAAQRIATGDLDATVALTGVGELRRFARTLEGMRESLADSHASLARQNLQLREVDRLKDEFIANTSHEIRTPLSSILGGIELLGEATPAERDELLDTLRRNGKHLLYLINQVLDFSKLQAGNLLIETQAVEIRPLLADIAACVLPQAREKKLSVSVQCADDLPTHVASDALRLRQVLMNLLANALKFTAAGGVELHAARSDGPAGAQLTITVVDTGMGMPAATLEKLFVPFAQGDASMTRRFGGTGLGLVISRQLARALGGELTLASREGVGTRAIVTLPLHAAVPTTPATPAPAPTPAAARATLARVLVVDDAPDNRRLLTAMLRKVGVAVEAAENGQVGIDAVHAAAAAGHAFDLVLMDIQMPVLNGYDAARQLRATGCKLPLVALTAHATGRDRETCLAAGFDDYATKPITGAQLNDLVRKYTAPAS